jgi:hypothetical protein
VLAQSYPSFLVILRYCPVEQVQILIVQHHVDQVRSSLLSPRGRPYPVLLTKQNRNLCRRKLIDEICMFPKRIFKARERKP